jgi:CRISPR-associated protein Csx3
MSPIQLALIPHQTQDDRAYQHLKIFLQATDGVISPEDLKGLQLPESIQFSEGIVIEGRGPIWLYGYLVHLCHPSAWVACYDPRLAGAVVVQTHTKGVSVGSVIPLSLPT